MLSWATLYRGWTLQTLKELYLQLDSHMRFVRLWDRSMRFTASAETSHEERSRSSPTATTKCRFNLPSLQTPANRLQCNAIRIDIPNHGIDSLRLPREQLAWCMQKSEKPVLCSYGRPYKYGSAPEWQPAADTSSCLNCAGSWLQKAVQDRRAFPESEPCANAPDKTVHVYILCDASFQDGLLLRCQQYPEHSLPDLEARLGCAPTELLLERPLLLFKLPAAAGGSELRSAQTKN
eukprot:1792442-Amphidinium_carterae.1